MTAGLGSLNTSTAGAEMELQHKSAVPDPVLNVLKSIETVDPVSTYGSGPIAIGAIPFNPSSPISLVVPEVVIGLQDNGLAWHTTVGTADSSLTSDSQPDVFSIDEVLTASPPDEFRLVAMPSHEQWLRMVEHALGYINKGEVDKLVLSRRVLVETNRPICRVEVIQRLRSLYPSCTIFNIDGFLGASPELLVRRTGYDVVSQPLAGTIAHSGDPMTDKRMAAELFSSPKERAEHDMAARAVAKSMDGICESLSVPSQPSLISLRNVSHLATEIRGKLLPQQDVPSVLQLASRLHPTPAVSGSPSIDALELISRLENYDRGHYAGPVGWMDKNGDGEFVLGIRSAQVKRDRAELFAGVGLVANSDPSAELMETQLKLQALLSAIVRP
ncbi:MAG TPA: isochorismate synthase [Acidimicrobiales bacterium]|nr:isochorismate synthase [Acidimicrobiales bacterium]